MTTVTEGDRWVARIWKYRDANLKAISQDMVSAADNIPLLAKLLAIRGITTPAEITAFLNLSQYQSTAATAFEGLEKAVDRILHAIRTQENILVYGDFDVDGITGTAILMQCLKHLGANVSFFVPDRHMEGHGLHVAALCRLVSARQVKVVITTDTGSTNFNEVNLLNGLHVDTIITDHHELSEHLPPALAILNPKLLPPDSPLAFLCGAGVAYKLCEALMQAMGTSQSEIDSLLDLVAVGTVVDMVPLLRENRYLVWRGLQVLAQRQRPGLKALLLEAGVNESAPITSQTLGFAIGPRLNAIGRLANATEGVELLLTTDPEQARQLAAKLEQLNRRRKDLVEKCLIQAESHLMNTGELTDQRAIILASPDWNPGIVGLVATKLIERHNRPCFIGCVDEGSQEVRFSARSVEGFDMVENLQTLSIYFKRWGGHSGAAGFAIDSANLQTFKAKLFKLCAERVTERMMLPVTWVDMKLEPSQVNPFLVDVVEKMAPFGQNNPLPTFGLEAMTIGAQRLIGDSQQHLKLVLTGAEPGRYLEAVHWGWGQNREKLRATASYRLAFTTEMNTYYNPPKLQLTLKDIQDETLSPVHEPLLEAIPAPEPAAPESPVVASQAPVLTTAGSGVDWVDHRGRDNLEEFFAQMLSTFSTDGTDLGQYRIFCEGTQRFMPLPLTDTLFLGRASAGAPLSTPHLILWDLPPDMPTLMQLIRTYQPKMLHLIGGKYQQIPFCHPPKAFLEGFVKVIYRLAKPQQATVLHVETAHLASLLSTSLKAVVTGLSLLQRMSMLEKIRVLDDKTVEICLSAQAPPIDETFQGLIEALAFQTALDEVYQFREWLMTAPLSVIQSGVSLEKISESPVLGEEPHEHAVHIVR